MSRFDMKEFGEAAPFLRKTELEQLTSHTVSSDGRPGSLGCASLSHLSPLHSRTHVTRITSMLLSLESDEAVL